MINVNFQTDIVDVVFPTSSRKYAFKVLPNLKGCLKAGDTVVVHTTSGFQVATVKEVNVYIGAKATDYVVDKVLMEEYKRELQRLTDIAAAKRRLKELQKSFQEKQLFEMMAEKMPEARELLKYITQLENGIPGSKEIDE